MNELTLLFIYIEFYSKENLLEYIIQFVETKGVYIFTFHIYI